ncbi:MAG: DUF481 domain-containing protein [Bacteroidales bacterium]|nr:DUF481 domain-containing protein [Bacteroidales bacterium]
MGFLVLVLVLVIVMMPQALSQGISPPPGWSEYVGPAENQPFTPSTVFPKPLVRPQAKPKPAELEHNSAPEDDIPHIGAGADGGLFQSLPIPVPSLPKLPKPWTGGAEFGLTGATGNTELLTFRGGWNLNRKTEWSTFYSDLLYTYSTQNSSLNANQALFNARGELPFPNRPYAGFSATQLEYDELRAYRFRVGTYLGTSYTLFDDSDKTTKFRAGAGATREIGVGGPRDRWVPELVFGYDFRYLINDRTAFLSVSDIYPRLGDQFGQYRIRARAAFEFVIDPESGTVLRLGLQDRYDSSPGNSTVRNDLTYFTTLGIKF